jgi:hypothetical protein
VAFRLSGSGGIVTDPAFVSVYASGVVRPGMAVEFTRGTITTQGFVTPASSSTTITNIFGVCLDYAQGASDVEVKVIPIQRGQLWEADCVGAAATLQIGKRQQLYGSNSVLINNNAYDQTGATGVFVIWNITGATTGSGKVLGEFLRVPAGVHQAGIAGELYF